MKFHHAETRSLSMTQRQASLLFLLIAEELEDRSPGRARRDELRRILRKLPGHFLPERERERWSKLAGEGLAPEPGGSS